MRRQFLACFGMAVTALALSPRDALGGEVHELRHDVTIDATVTATAFVLVIGAELGKADLAPNGCRWCDRNADGTDALNGVDRGARSALRWEDIHLAAHISDGFGFLGAPLVDFGTLLLAGQDAHAGKYFGVDALLLGEVVMTNGFVNEVVKLVAARERPFVHAMAPSDKPHTSHPADNDLSFYSGHTSASFALAAGGGTIAALRGYRLAPLIFGAGGAIAALTGYLRIAADKHYVTDVLTGAIVGSAIGIGLPMLFHGRGDEASAGTPSIASGAGTMARPPALVSLGGGF
jgi:membrane-associated phospholipid phosphatase